MFYFLLINTLSGWLKLGLKLCEVDRPRLARHSPIIHNDSDPIFALSEDSIESDPLARMNRLACIKNLRIVLHRFMFHAN